MRLTMTYPINGVTTVVFTPTGHGRRLKRFGLDPQIYN